MVAINNELVIKCGECSTSLANCVSTIAEHFSEQENSMKSQYIIEGCPKCGGKSYPSQIVTGRGHLNPFFKNTYLEFVSTDIHDDIIVSVLRVKK